MVAPLEAAPIVDEVRLAEPVGSPVDPFAPEVTTTINDETDRHPEAVFFTAQANRVNGTSQSDVAESGALANTRPVSPVDRLTVPVDSKVFHARPHASFHVGMTAALGVVLMPREYVAAQQLRANVYIDEKGFLDNEARNALGGEHDADDSRSIHFGVLENHPLSPRTVGVSRLILKRECDGPLPVERHFPEAFSDQPAPVGSVEASRYIARHPDRTQQQGIALAGIRSMVMHALTSGAPHIYAIVERPLAAYFRQLGIPYETIARQKMIEEYNTKNMAIRFDPRAIFAAANDPKSDGSLLAKTFQDAGANLGLGYYDENLQERIA